jgi:cyclohexadieny/prephenate dehydrogenase
MLLNQLTIVGVGLIGASLGLAARRLGFARRVVGLGRNPASLEQAARIGAIDQGCLHGSEAVAGADFVVVCTPVDLIARQVLELSKDCKPGTLFTDAGSTKSLIVKAIETGSPSNAHFVGGHPLAGSEKKGPEHADATLFRNRWTVLTPTPRTNPEALAKVREFWESLGSHVRIMTPEAHDATLALTSHLPHLVASALAGLLPASAFDLAATGFRDTTRVAAGDPALWSAIFQHNREALLASLGATERRLADFRNALESSDWNRVQDLLAQGKKVRDALGS